MIFTRVRLIEPVSIEQDKLWGLTVDNWILIIVTVLGTIITAVLSALVSISIFKYQIKNRDKIKINSYFTHEINFIDTVIQGLKDVLEEKERINLNQVSTLERQVKEFKTSFLTAVNGISPLESNRLENLITEIEGLIGNMRFRAVADLPDSEIPAFLQDVARPESLKQDVEQIEEKWNKYKRELN